MSQQVQTDIAATKNVFTISVTCKNCDLPVQELHSRNKLKHYTLKKCRTSKSTNVSKERMIR